VASLGSELMRASVAAGEPTSKDILLWDSLGLRADAITTLRDRYGLSISAALLDMTDNADSSFGPAAALALLVLRGQSLPIDFLHSRLAAPKKHRIGRKAIWAAAIVVAILIGIAASIWSQQNQQRDLDDLNARLKQMQPDLTAARAMDAKVSAADGWYANRPSMLECLEHITAAFPQEGSIWATNISIRDNGLGTVTGRARDQNAVLTVYDHMKNDPKFSKATVDYIRQGTGSNAKQITFSISFSFSL
jgi:Tfp pilus assembly protein PilN